MRAALYARVSSTGQRDRHTIESQLRDLPALAASRGWTVAETYVDDGHTARAGHLGARAAFARLLADAAAGRFEVVVVVDLDRLTRAEDLAERGAVLGAFQRAGVQVAVASTGQLLDLTTSSGDLLASLGAFFAAEENRKRSERTKAGKLTAISRGRKPSGPTPYGYRYNSAPGAWSIDEVAAAVIREIYSRAAGGESCYRIAIDLEARGVPRPRGGGWQRGRVWQLLRSSAYRGCYVADTRRGLTIAVPVIVEEDLWYAAQAATAARRTCPTPRAHSPALLEGIATCALCGSRIYITGGKGGRRYYVCGDKRRPGRGVPRCPCRMRRVEAADQEVWESVRLALDDLALAGEVGAAVRHDAAPAHDWAAEALDYDRRLVRLERAEGQILEAYRRGRIGESAWRRELAAAARDRVILVRSRDTAREALSGARREVEDHATAMEQVESLRGHLGAATAHDRRALARALGWRATIYSDRIVLDGGPAAEVVPADGAACSREPSHNVNFRAVTR